MPHGTYLLIQSYDVHITESEIFKSENQWYNSKYKLSKITQKLAYVKSLNSHDKIKNKPANELAIAAVHDSAVSWYEVAKVLNSQSPFKHGGVKSSGRGDSGHVRRKQSQL